MYTLLPKSEYLFKTQLKMSLLEKQTPNDFCANDIFYRFFEKFV